MEKTPTIQLSPNLYYLFLTSLKHKDWQSDIPSSEFLLPILKLYFPVSFVIPDSKQKPVFYFLTLLSKAYLNPLFQ